MLIINNLLLLSVILFTIGFLGLLTRRNAIVAFMSVEIMLNAGNLLIVSFASYHRSLDGVMIAFFMIVIAAVEAVVGLSIILMLHRHKAGIYINNFNTLGS
ncbi:MAG: NADH-quinone oxidoreductase subunit NuoK [SAR324 cluster bacterium]|nr:NADH-quinone oxidoreductase subunit NuoK [SAR324 cluster bacterium]